MVESGIRILCNYVQILPLQYNLRVKVWKSSDGRLWLCFQDFLKLR